MVRIDGEYKYRLYSKPIVRNNIPQLAWDISPALRTRKVAEKDEISPRKKY